MKNVSIEMVAIDTGEVLSRSNFKCSYFTPYYRSLLRHRLDNLIDLTKYKDFCLMVNVSEIKESLPIIF